MLSRAKQPGAGWKACNTRYQVQASESADRQDRAVEKRVRQEAIRVITQARLHSES